MNHQENIEFNLINVLLASLLVFSSIPAWSSWAKMAQTDYAALYIDQTTIQKTSQTIKVTELQDLFPENSKTIVLSFKFQKEYNCTTRKFRILDAIPYSGNMLSGETLTLTNKDNETTLKIGQWQTADTNSPFQIILNSVCHEWVKIVDSDTGSLYIDPTSIQIKNQFVSAWELIDLKRKDEKYGFFSLRWLKEYDCREKLYRDHQFYVHSDNMASGNIISSDLTTTKWKALNDNKKAILPILCEDAKDIVIHENKNKKLQPTTH